MCADGPAADVAGHHIPSASSAPSAVTDHARVTSATTIIAADSVSPCWIGQAAVTAADDTDGADANALPAGGPWAASR